MELLTKQVSLSLALGQAGQGRAQLSSTAHLYGFWAVGLMWPFHFARQSLAPIDPDKQVVAVPGVKGRAPSTDAAPRWRTGVRFLGTRLTCCFLSPIPRAGAVPTR